jgi:dTDP-4-amino-4,6-dideoxygalactose transaminase
LERIPLVDVKRQYDDHAEEIKQRVLAVLASGGYVSGAEVAILEHEFAAYCGVRHAIAVNSGTAALHAALLALGAGPGDEVVTVAHTFGATVEAIVMTGASPVFVDIDPDTYTMQPSQIEAVLTPRTRVILPVHLYGLPAAMGEIGAIAARRGLAVIEDACQAHGAVYRGKRAGAIGAIGCFSFYPSKNLGGAGEGGMITTDSDELDKRMRVLRDHGQSRRYYHEVLGYNYRLSELQAAVLNAKMPYLDAGNDRRREIARLYTEELDGLDLHLPDERVLTSSVFHLYVVGTPRRNELAKHLETRGVSTGLHYPVPLHLQPAFERYGNGPGSLPVTEAAAETVLSLPMYPELTDENVRRICAAIREFFSA